MNTLKSKSLETTHTWHSGKSRGGFAKESWKCGVCGPPKFVAVLWSQKFGGRERLSTAQMLFAELQCTRQMEYFFVAAAPKS